MEQQDKEYYSHRHCQSRQNLREYRHRRIPFATALDGDTIGNINIVKLGHQLLGSVYDIDITLHFGYQRYFRHAVAVLQHAVMPLRLNVGNLPQRHACQPGKTHRLAKKPVHIGGICRCRFQHHRDSIIPFPDSGHGKAGGIAQCQCRFKNHTVQPEPRRLGTIGRHKH